MGIISGSGTLITSATLAHINARYTSPAINRNGNDFVMGVGMGPNTVGVMTQQGFREIGAGSEWSSGLTNTAINDHGDVAFTRWGTTVYPQNAVGLVGVLRGGSTEIQTVASTGDGYFRTLGASFGGVAINGNGEVAFAAERIPLPGGVTDTSVYVGNATGRRPLPVATFGESIGGDGTTYGYVQQQTISPQSINENGQVVFYAWTFKGSALQYALLRADPVVGASPGNPVMPRAGDTLPGGGWTLRTRGWGQRAVTYIDPEIAIGYDYTLDGGPNFASIFVPAPLPGGDADFTLQFGGQSFALSVGVEFDITRVVPGGISAFRIAGIDPAEALDPAGHTFVIGLTFIAESANELAIKVVPLTAAVPEPEIWAIWLAGVSLLGTCAARRGRQPS